MKPNEKKVSGKTVSSWKQLIVPALTLLILVAAFAIYTVINYIPFTGLLLKKDLDTVDLRGRGLTIESYQQLQQQMPQCRIIWDVPLGGKLYSSNAEKIAISSVDPADFPMFNYFDSLKEVVAKDATCYEELLALEEYLPDCKITWGIHLGVKSYSINETSLNLSSARVKPEELMTELAWFPELTQVEISGETFTQEEKLALVNQYPGITFLWQVTAAGKTWMSTDTTLSYAGEELNVDELLAAAGLFYGVEEIDLTGTNCTNEQLVAIYDAFGGPVIHSRIKLWGRTFKTDVTHLDFSGRELENADELEQLIPLLPNLEKVVMCDCGISNEDMDALNKRYENIRFIWRVRFSVYSLRTDATFFCASDLPGNGYVAIKMTDEQLEPLKYCTDLVALDLGHMRYTDLSFLENMPKLRYLVLVEAKFSDITPIGTLKELEYLEIFMNTFSDLSPLLNCTNLKHLNIGYTKGFDVEVLKQMTQLERLWYPGNTMNAEQIQAIKAALPNTMTYLPGGDPQGSTGGGWREHESYYEMRNIFKMHYMPGGTGMNRN